MKKLRKRWQIKALVAAVLGSLAFAASAHASKVSTSSNIPITTLGSGETVDASIYIENVEGGSDPLRIGWMFFAPSCRQISGATCEAGDKFVYNIQNAVGTAGTRCAGMTFAITASDGQAGDAGYYTFEPSEPLILDPPNSPGNSDACGITLEASAGHGPELDVDAELSEQQTYNALIVGGVTRNGNTSIPWDHRSFSKSTMNRRTLDLGLGVADDSVGEGEQIGAALTTNEIFFFGSVTFRLFGPDDPSCANAPLSTKTTTEDSKNMPAASDPYLPTEVGTYRWTLTFAGDRDHKPLSTACGAPGTTVQVKDTTAPVASFAKTPKAKVRLKRSKRSKTVRFSLASSEAGATFECRLDGAGFAPCEPETRMEIRKGKHLFEAVAVDPSGNASDSIQHAFKVARKRK